MNLGVKIFSISLAVAIGCFTFIENAKAVNDTILFQQNKTANSSALLITSTTSTNRTEYAFNINSDNDVSICSLTFTASRSVGSWIDDKYLDVYLVSNYDGLNVWNPDEGQQIKIATIPSTDIAPWPNYSTTTATTTLCYPIFPKSIIGTKYYILFRASWYGSNAGASENDYFAIQTTQNGTAHPPLTSLRIMDYPWVFPIESRKWLYLGNSVDIYQSPVTTIRGNTSTGVSLDQLGGFVVTNSSTGAGFFSYCNIGIDWGWWTPLLNMAQYLVCPDPALQNEFDVKYQQFITRAPWGYYPYIRDKFVDQTTTSTDHFVLNFVAPNNLGTTGTADITQSYLDVPADIRAWVDLWIVRIVWIAIFIAALVRLRAWTLNVS